MKKNKHPRSGKKNSASLYQKTSRPVRFQDKELLSRLENVAGQHGTATATIVTWLTRQAFEEVLRKGTVMHTTFKKRFPVQPKYKQ